jgi:hypothetical protein
MAKADILYCIVVWLRQRYPFTYSLVPKSVSNGKLVDLLQFDGQTAFLAFSHRIRFAGFTTTRRLRGTARHIARLHVRRCRFSVTFVATKISRVNSQDRN